MRPRAATPDDLATIFRIVRAAYAPYIRLIGRPPAPMEDDYAARLRDGQLDVIDAAPSAGTDRPDPVGCVVLIDTPGALLLDNVAVDPAWQGRGIGRRLLDHAERVARDRGYPAIRLYTNAAMTGNIALYARSGYAQTGRLSESGFDRVWMEKALTP